MVTAPHSSANRADQDRPQNRSTPEKPHPALPWLQALLLAVAFAMLLGYGGQHARAETAKTIPDQPPARIEVAFVLDTTGSMSGLIEGAKKKIWSIASNLIDLKPQPEIRFGLIGYRDRGDEYITKTYDLTEDVQLIYGRLLEFRAAGGGDNPESVNQALAEAVNDLSWSEDEDVFRVIFLVGDAPPQMQYANDTPYPETLRAAVAADIVVNAIQAGDQRATTPIWKEIAQLGGGEFAQIAQDGAMVSVETPYDAEIQRINNILNDAVLPYGDREQQAMIESKVSSAKGALSATASDMAGYFRKRGDDRIVSGGGDLVSDLDEGRIELDAIEPEALPKPMQAMSGEERAEYLAENRAQRSAAQAELDALLEKRAAWLAEQAPEEPDDAFDARVKSMVTEQAARKGFKPAE